VLRARFHNKIINIHCILIVLPLRAVTFKLLVSHFSVCHISVWPGHGRRLSSIRGAGKLDTGYYIATSVKLAVISKQWVTAIEDYQCKPLSAGSSVVEIKKN